MRLITNRQGSKLETLGPTKPIILTIGNFDGVHLGHQSILAELRKIGQDKNLETAVLTFEPHPLQFFKKNDLKNFRLNSLAQKLKIFREEKIDHVIILPFNQKLAEISAEDFVEKILVKSLQMKHLIVGHDFVFGKNRRGDFNFLESCSKHFAFDLSKISAVKDSDKIFSSSLVRSLIIEGKVRLANDVLGRNFAVEGIVIEGKKLASELGFPTANLSLKPTMIKPKFGVYKSETFLPHLNQKFPSITNFGMKPTLQSEEIPLFETHIIGFSQKIYGKKIITELTDFVREEKKFSSLEALKQQIKDDIQKIL